MVNLYQRMVNMIQIDFLNEEDLSYKYKIGDKLKFMGEKSIIVNRNKFSDKERNKAKIGGLKYILYFYNLKDYYTFSEEDIEKYGKVIS